MAKRPQQFLHIAPKSKRKGAVRGSHRKNASSGAKPGIRARELVYAGMQRAGSILKDRQVASFAVGVYAVYINYFLLWFQALSDHPWMSYAGLIAITSALTVFARYLIRGSSQGEFDRWRFRLQAGLPLLLVPDALFLLRAEGKTMSWIVLLATLPLLLYLSWRTLQIRRETSARGRPSGRHG